MTSEILALPLEKPEQYHLPEIHRQAILAQSSSAILRSKIERQRQEFMQRYGDAFGAGSNERGESRRSDIKI
jgi:hypothetical protein